MSGSLKSLEVCVILQELVGMPVPHSYLTSLPISGMLSLAKLRYQIDKTTDAYKKGSK